MEEIEVHIFPVMMQEINSNVHDVVSKGTEVPVLTTHHRVHRVACGVRRAELRFVFVRVVELLYTVVRI